MGGRAGLLVRLVPPGLSFHIHRIDRTVSSSRHPRDPCAALRHSHLKTQPHGVCCRQPLAPARRVGFEGAGVCVGDDSVESGVTCGGPSSPWNALGGCLGAPGEPHITAHCVGPPSQWVASACSVDLRSPQHVTGVWGQWNVTLPVSSPPNSSVGPGWDTPLSRKALGTCPTTVLAACHPQCPGACLFGVQGVHPMLRISWTPGRPWCFEPPRGQEPLLSYSSSTLSAFFPASPWVLKPPCSWQFPPRQPPRRPVLSSPRTPRAASSGLLPAGPPGASVRHPWSSRSRRGRNEVMGGEAAGLECRGRGSVSNPHLVADAGNHWQSPSFPSAPASSSFAGRGTFPPSVPRRLCIEGS